MPVLSRSWASPANQAKIQPHGMAFMMQTEDDMNLSHSGENTKFEASSLDEEN